MNHLSLFSGSGIGTLAAASVGIRTVAHAENDPACCYCLERLWPDARLFRDVRDVTAESVADLGPIDIISGGFPCQDVSTAGKGEGLGTEENPTRSGLWYEFARVIRETRPTWLLIENVPALRKRGGDRVCEDLEAMDYAWEASVVGADDVGAPHRRKRVWIVAYSRREQRRARRATRSGLSEVQGQDGDDQRCGESLADPIGNLCGRGSNESERGPEGRTAVGRAGESGELADTAESRRTMDAAVGGIVCRSNEPPAGCADGFDRMGATRWPARPGEPQHEFEAPRLIEFGVGDAVDGLPRRIRSRANKALLRMVGNAWTYPNAVILFRAIMELEANQ